MIVCLRSSKPLVVLIALLFSSTGSIPVAFAHRASEPASNGFRPAPYQSAPIGDSSQPWHKLGIDVDGIYRLTCSQLASAGVDLAAIDPRTIKIYAGGAEIAIDVSGQADGICDPADTITFYATAIHTTYVDSNIYWLTYGGPAGKRLATRFADVQQPAQPDTFAVIERHERDLLYRSYMPFVDGADHWFWAFNTIVDTPTLAAAAESVAPNAIASLQIEVVAYQAGAHDTGVYVNGTALGDVKWTSVGTNVATFPFSNTFLLRGPNAITITEVGTGGVVAINTYTLTYHSLYSATNNLLAFSQPTAGDYRFTVSGFSDPAAHVYDVTDPFNITQIQNQSILAVAPSQYTLIITDAVSAPRSQYLAFADSSIRTPTTITRDIPSDLHRADNGADYIIIAPSALITTAQPLAAWRAAQGMRVKVVDAQDVYDEFNNGLMDSGAIHDFLGYAHQYWQPPAPTYALLAGIGTLDPKGIYGGSKVNLLPTTLSFVDPVNGETASDNRFVTFDANTILPDMAIGRLPALNVADMDAMVSKIIQYERNPAPGAWRSQVTFASDTYYCAGRSGCGNTGYDRAGNFWAMSDRVAADPGYMPTPFVADRIYYNLCPSPSLMFCSFPYSTYTTSTTARNAITKALQSGRLLVNYVGHAGLMWWGNNQILMREDYTTLSNGQQLPVLLEMTCLTGAFHFYISSSMAEVAVRQPNGGALASWSSSGEGVGAGHDYLDQGFFDAVMNHGQYRIGLAALAGKQYLWDNSMGAFHDLIDTFNLLGDPASRLSVGLWLSTTLDVPATATTGMPVTLTANLVDLGPFDTGGAVISVTLPPNLQGAQLIGASQPVTPVMSDNGAAFQVGDLSAGDSVVMTWTAALAPQPLVMTRTARSTFGTAIIITTTATALTPHPDQVMRLDTGQTNLVRRQVYLPLLAR